MPIGRRSDRRWNGLRCRPWCCASWSDHGLHTRGSLEGFERIASAQKWLYTHGGRKWERFYAPEAREVQRRFFDHFLKGEPNGWETTPRVRLAVRRSREVCDMRATTDRPLTEVTYVTLYLDAVTGTLTAELPANEGMVQYDPRGGPRDRASFVYRFEHDTELTGGNDALALGLHLGRRRHGPLRPASQVRRHGQGGLLLWI